MVKRVHMLTAAALLELDFEQPSLDYHQLMKLTKILTNGKAEDIENMFRRMCFNVFATTMIIQRILLIYIGRRKSNGAWDQRMI